MGIYQRSNASPEAWGELESWSWCPIYDFVEMIHTIVTKPGEKMCSNMDPWEKTVEMRALCHISIQPLYLILKAGRNSTEFEYLKHSIWSICLWKKNRKLISTMRVTLQSRSDHTRTTWMITKSPFEGRMRKSPSRSEFPWMNIVQLVWPSGTHLSFGSTPSRNPTLSWDLPLKLKNEVNFFLSR